MSSGASGSTAQPIEAEQPPFEASLVEEMLRSLVKAMRAHQLYLPNNPMHQRALDHCKTAFAPVWQRAAEIALEVTETDLRWHGQPVMSEPEKASDSLPWLLYKDGIREIQIAAGFEIDELPMLLQIIQRVRRASPDEDDLITLLWEQDFGRLRYQYVELAIEGFTGIEKAAFEERKVVVEAATQAAEGASGIVSMSDFDSTLYFLDTTEIGYLEAEVGREYASDLRSNVAAMLLDIFETQVDDHVRDELIELLDYYLIHLLSTQAYSSASYLLRECTEAGSRGRGVTHSHKEKLAQLPHRLSEKDALSQLLLALEDAQSVPPQDDLEQLFGQLRGSALEILLGWISRLQSATLRPLLEGAAQRLALSNTSELVRLITSGEHEVRLEAMRRAGAIKTAAAVGPLTGAVADAHPEVRLTAVNALASIASPGSMQALERAIEDEVRDVRIAAVRSLAAQSYRPALPRVEAAVKGRSLRDSDLTEKMAFFEAYGLLAGENGIAYLDGVLNGKGLFGKREEPDVRACAAIALGQIGSDRAMSSLQKASGERDVVVRSAINRAFRGSST